MCLTNSPPSRAVATVSPGLLSDESFQATASTTRRSLYRVAQPSFYTMKPVILARPLEQIFPQGNQQDHHRGDTGARERHSAPLLKTGHLLPSKEKKAPREAGLRRWDLEG
jgi:hypothetical protein